MPQYCYANFCNNKVSYFGSFCQYHKSNKKYGCANTDCASRNKRGYERILSSPGYCKDCISNGHTYYKYYPNPSTGKIDKTCENPYCSRKTSDKRFCCRCHEDRTKMYCARIGCHRYAETGSENCSACNQKISDRVSFKKLNDYIQFCSNETCQVKVKSPGLCEYCKNFGRCVDCNRKMVEKGTSCMKCYLLKPFCEGGCGTRLEWKGTCQSCVDKRKRYEYEYESSKRQSYQSSDVYCQWSSGCNSRKEVGDLCWMHHDIMMNPR